jgi:hypothetical protein
MYDIKERLILPISPVPNKIYDCIENVISTAAKWFDADCSLMFTESFTFGFVTKTQPYPPQMFKESRGYSFLPTFDTEHENLNYRICTNKGSAFETLKQYSGFVIVEHAIEDFDGFLKLLTEYLPQNIPVGAHIDSFWCPWDPTYQQNHMIHYCLVVGVDFEKKIAYCLDPYLNNDLNEMPFSCFKNGGGTSYTFSKTEPEKKFINPRELAADIAQFSRKNRDGHNTFEYMRMLAEEIRTMPDMDEVIRSYSEFQTVPFFILLSHISWARKNIAHIFEQLNINGQDEFLNNAARNLEQASVRWGVVRGKLIKACLLKKFDSMLPNCADYLDSLASFEESISNELLQA